MLAFIALTYYMGIVKKNLITSYWSVDSTIATPFPRTVMSRNEFENILLFFIAVTIVNMLPKDSLDTILRKSLVLLMRNQQKIFAIFGHPIKILQLMKEQFHLKVGFTLNVIIQTNQTNMGLRPLTYVTHLMHAAVCQTYMLGKLMMVQKLLNLGKRMT